MSNGIPQLLVAPSDSASLIYDNSIFQTGQITLESLSVTGVSSGIIMGSSSSSIYFGVPGITGTWKIDTQDNNSKLIINQWDSNASDYQTMMVLEKFC